MLRGNLSEWFNGGTVRGFVLPHINGNSAELKLANRLDKTMPEEVLSM